MRYAAILAAITLPLLVGACKETRKNEDAQAVDIVRAAVPSVEAYYQDHNGYTGATLAKLRNIYDRGIANISIVRASKQTYCIEATAADSHAFKNGPAAEIMLGSCKDPENGKPYASPQSNDSSNTADTSDVSLPLLVSIPAIEAYEQDHDGYTGMTIAKLSKTYDPSIAGVSIVEAGKNTYCIETVAGTPRVFFEGPAGPLMIGSCSDPKHGKPFNPPSSEESPPSSEPLDASGSLRASVVAVESYYYDHGSYTGMTPPKLREQYDAGLPDIKIVSAKKTTYCIEITVDGTSAFKSGPTGDVTNGTCPT
ncbi:MAG: hypothetical protein ABSC51_02435 [Gaiellaceae bacterium]|jgi:Tfp pilus assembly protein PilE